MPIPPLKTVATKTDYASLKIFNFFFETIIEVAGGCGDAVRSISRLSFGCLVLKNS